MTACVALHCAASTLFPPEGSGALGDEPPILSSESIILIIAIVKRTERGALCWR
jgi:hypothetical protein